MPRTYKLTYFDGAGRGEAIRLCFVQAGIEFEDIRLSFEQWGELKKKVADAKPFRFPWLPLLEVDGGKFVISQSLPMLRFAAKEAGLCPKTEPERLMAESLLELYDELIPAYAKVMFAPTPEAKKEKAAAFQETFNTKSGFFETILSQNNGGKGYIVGNSLSVADIAVFSICREANKILTGAGSPIDFGNKPLLKSFNERIGNEPKIKAYYSK